MYSLSCRSIYEDGCDEIYIKEVKINRSEKFGQSQRDKKEKKFNNKDPVPRLCEGQRKESSDLNRERGKIETVPGMISGESSTEEMAVAGEGI